MINIPKGTKDVIPNESYKWHYIENVVKSVAENFCVKEIRTPTFEHTELFLRGVGDTTDIVNKEMYTFIDKGGRSITLKPEGTAGVARAFIENSLYANPQPTKMYYITPVFRYERPQNGRLREHHQFGIEYFGSESPYADIEVMTIAKNIFDKLGVENITLNINSIGCPECRKKYNEILKSFLKDNFDKLCNTCRDRFDKNPLRILDCKEDNCKRLLVNAPKVLDYLCEDCKTHHQEVCKGLDDLGIEYVVNPQIVRGLDYYTRTVFEFISNNVGSQGTICGGGRYNNLIEQIGGNSCPAVGFGMGIERLILLLENLGLSCGEESKVDIYIAPICDKAKSIALKLSVNLREKGLNVEQDLMNRSAKAQMKYANKLGTNFVIMIGEDEINSNTLIIKNMKTGENSSINFDYNAILNKEKCKIDIAVDIITEEINKQIKKDGN